MKNIGVFFPFVILSMGIHAQTAKPSTFVQNLEHQMKAKLKLSNAQADTAVLYEIIYLKKSGKLQRDKELPEDSVASVVKTLQIERNSQIQESLQLPKKQLKKLLSILPATAPKPKTQ